MENLSHLLGPDPVSALCPTSQAAGNMTSSNRDAMTAPGGRPVDPLPDRSEQGDPEIDTTGHARTTVTDGRDTGLNGGRPVLRRGEWNDLTGGAS
jgi:hypothetical protein